MQHHLFQEQVEATSLSEQHTLTLSLGEIIRCQRFCSVCAGSAQDLLDDRRAELSKVGPTQASGAVDWQTVDPDQLFSRETQLGERKINK